MTQRFTLPKTMQARNWVRSTDTLRAHLQARLASIHARAEVKRKEAEEIEKEAPALEQAVALLDQLLPPKTVPTPISTAVAQDGQGSARTSRWSLMYERCIDCGTTVAKHIAHGRCVSCDNAWRRRPHDSEEAEAS